MKQLLTGLTSIILCCTVLQAQSFTISGKVLDATTNESLPGASVYAISAKNNRSAGALTNAEGDFKLNIDVSADKTVRLRVTCAGFTARQIDLKAVSHENLIITLKQIPSNPDPGLVIRYARPMEPVEIRAIRANAKAPFSKTNLSKADIEKNNLGQDLPFLLNQTPSVVANSDAGNGIGYTGLRIRGTDATRINMTINGVPYNDAESQGIFFVNLPDLSSSASSLQIQRGVGSSSNGAGAFGATLSFSTTEHLPKPYAEINNSWGSFNSRKHTVKAGTGLLNGGFTIDARVSAIESDGFIDRASTSLRSLFMSTAWQDKTTSVRFILMKGAERTYQAWYGIPESKLNSDRTFNSAGTEKPGTPYEDEVDNYNQDHYQLLVNHSFNERLKMNITSFFTPGKGYFEQYKAGQKFSNYGLPNVTIGTTTITETNLVRRLWLDNDYYGQTFSLQYNQRNTSLIYGGAWTRYKGRHFGEIIWAQYGVDQNHRWYDLPALKTDLNHFVKWQQQISSRISLYTDVQYRHVDYRINGFRNTPSLLVNNTYNFINPKAGLTYNNNNAQASLSWAMANKEPNRDDFEASVTEQPRHETLHDVELNLSKTINSRATISSTVYYMAYRNQLILTGRINDVGAYTRQNIPRSYRAGIELQAATRMGSYVTLNANLALSRNKIKSFNEFIDDYDNGGQKTISHSNKDIAFSPAIVGGATLSIARIRNLDIRLMEKYTGRQYLDNTQDKARSLDGFFIQDIVLDYKLPLKAIRECRLLLQVNNVFNTKYAPNGYTFSYIAGGQSTTENFYFPMAGINFMVGLNVKL